MLTPHWFPQGISPDRECRLWSAVSNRKGQNQLQIVPLCFINLYTLGLEVRAVAGRPAAICNGYRFPSEARQKCRVSLSWTASLQLCCQRCWGCPAHAKAITHINCIPKGFTEARTIPTNLVKNQTTSVALQSQVEQGAEGNSCFC